YAVGGNPQVARASGIRVNRTLVFAHVLCGVCAALSGLFLASRLGAGAPWVGPQGGYDLDSIAAVVLGGVALTGGRGRLLGALGELFVIVAGELDLSVGALITTCVVIAARVGAGDPHRTWPVVALLVAFGVLVGLVNGLVTTILRVPSFITTLGTMLVLDGAV